jgi:glycosyltransferase involved in cell wall biosynthesis
MKANDTVVVYVVPYAKQDAYFPRLYGAERAALEKCMYRKALIPCGGFEIRPARIGDVVRIVWRRLFLSEPSMIHHHWLEARDVRQAVRLVIEMLLLRVYVRAGGAIVWTIHNKWSHSGRFRSLDLFAARCMVRWAAVLHVHGAGVFDELARLYRVSNRSKFVVYPHPEFSSMPCVPVERARTRVPAEIQEFVSQGTLFLSMGRIDAYKGVDWLARTFGDLPGYCRLLIVGDLKRGTSVSLSDLPANVHWLRRFVPNDELPFYYGLSRYSLFGFRDVLTSGSVYRALSAGHTVVIPAIGCLADLGRRANVRLYPAGGTAELRRLILGIAAENVCCHSDPS